MHDIIEHYGKVIVALAGALAAVLLTIAVVGVVRTKTTSAIDQIAYKEQVYSAFGQEVPSDPAPENPVGGV